jgi:hypothetical protein
VTTKLDVTIGKLDDAMLGKFRTGSFESQTKEVQTAWLFFAKLVGCVQPGWRDEHLVRSQRMSKATHTTDEALVLWILTYYRSNWESEAQHDAAFVATNESTSMPKRYKPKGHQKAEVYLRNFYDFDNDVYNKRNATSGENSLGWEEAIMDNALIEHQRKINNVAVGGVGDPDYAGLSIEEMMNERLPDGVTVTSIRVRDGDWEVTAI